MCLCALFYHTVPDYPLAMAANREEVYSRRARRPAWLEDRPYIFAGQDLVAGGTWQGINRNGVLVALTNGRTGNADPDRRSRGLLCLDVLEHPTAVQARHWLQGHLRQQAYNSFNLICADSQRAFAVHSSDPPQIEELEPGD
ncbi:MAG: hypothetical protein GKR89_15995 [Candidatus Latescibacteria bacterium]|nr:hypothetical protein [Candidatus Latescibacterota bacterium]